MEYLQHHGFYGSLFPWFDEDADLQQPAWSWEPTVRGPPAVSHRRERPQPCRRPALRDQPEVRSRMVLDRFSPEDRNAVVFAASGTGKSFFRQGGAGSVPSGRDVCDGVDPWASKRPSWRRRAGRWCACADSDYLMLQAGSRLQHPPAIRSRWKCSVDRDRRPFGLRTCGAHRGLHH
jgi:hypothetical protein